MYRSWVSTGGILAFLLLCSCSNTSSTLVKGNKTTVAGNNVFPAIQFQSVSDNSLTKIVFSCFLLKGSVKVEVPIERLPRSTSEFTKNAIKTTFFPNRYYFSNEHGFGEDTNIDNYRGRVDFVLYFSPIKNPFEYVGLWQYSLAADHVPSWKPNGLLHLLVNTKGKVVYGQGAEWILGEVLLTKDKRCYLDILTDLPGRHSPEQHAEVTSYKVNEHEELEFIKSRSKDVNEYWSSSGYRELWETAYGVKWGN